jgi:serine protein kinase
MSDIFGRIQKRKTEPQMMTLLDYLDHCRTDEWAYATAPQRLKKAMGEPEIFDSSKDTRLSKVFQNRKVKRFKKFSDFYGIEPAIEAIYETVMAASQGLEEHKQIMYLLGPVGSAKSSLADRLKELMEQEPIYVLAVKKGDDFEFSPMYESPLGLFPKDEAAAVEKDFKINPRHITGVCSPWATKRLTKDLGGDMTKFWVGKMYPSITERIGIVLVAPSDDNNQDVSDLIGKIDVRKLENFASNDPDAYSYSGGLCRATQGILDFMEMFKAPLKTLNPLLSATAEKRFVGNENVGMMPFNGMILAHSNESEWDKFRADRHNEAFLDRIKLIKVRYNLQLTEEELIYRKDIARSDLRDIPVAPLTYEFLARPVIASRLKDPDKGTLAQKVQIYDGRNVRHEHANAPTLHDLKQKAGLNEGMTGISTRLAFKILSRSANAGDELALDPIELFNVMVEEFQKEFGQEKAEVYVKFTKEEMKSWLYPEVSQMMHEAAMEDFNAYGQNLFERYVQLERRLGVIEKPAEIANERDFRKDVVMWVDRRVRETGTFPNWTDYRRMENIVRKLIRDETEKLLPKISFGGKKADKETEEKRSQFLERMKQRGYTARQVMRIVNWRNNFNVTS